MGNDKGDKKMLKGIIGITALLLIMLTGCALPMKPGLTSSTEKLDLGDDGLLLLTAELSNDFQPSYQPEAKLLLVEAPEPKGVKDRYEFFADEEGTVLSKNMNKYIFRARLKSGNYVVRVIRGSSGVFPIRGRFLVPLHFDIEVKKGEVVSLGKIVARTRKRKEDELRAGPIFPLIDQSVTGFSEATFDVTPLTSQNEDMNTMKTLFPVLRTAQIVEKTLSPFNRDVAQRWWDRQP